MDASASTAERPDKSTSTTRPWRAIRRPSGAGGVFMAGLIWTIVVVLFALWLIGVAVHIGGGLINLLLLLVVIGIIYNLVVGRRAV